MAYRCGPTAIGSRASWAPLPSPTVSDKPFPRPLSGTFDRIFNAFERTNAFEYVKSASVDKDFKEERLIGHGDVVVNRKMSCSLEKADCALAAQTPGAEDEDWYREKVLYSQARQLFPLQEDLADWINKTIDITYLTGENFLDVIDNGVELCQLAAVIHDRARDAIDQGLIVGPVPMIRGRCWQRAARRSFFSRDNTDNFLSFCRELGVHENLLFESDDLVLHNQPRQVILCLLEVARLASRYGVEPPGLVQLEREIALEERDSGLDSAMSHAAWQFRGATPPPTPPATASQDRSIEPAPSSPDPDNTARALCALDDQDAESTRSEETAASTDSDVPLKPTNELDKRVQLVTRLMERGCRCGAGAGRCSKLLKVRKVGEGRYNIAGRNVFIRLLKGRHMMVRVGGGWDTLEHFLSRHEPCQVRLVTQGKRADVLPVPVTLSHADTRTDTHGPDDTHTDDSLSPISRKHSNVSLSSKASSKDASLGSVSPVETDSKGSSSGKEGRRTSTPARPNSASSGHSSAEGRRTSTPARPNSASSGHSSAEGRRTSTPARPSSARGARAGLSLPLRTDSVDATQPKASRARKQSAPSFSTPNTPTARAPARTPPAEFRKSLTSANLTNAPKKSRSMSLALNPTQEKKFCGTDKLNAARKGQMLSPSAATTPTAVPRTARSQSLATTPVGDTRKTIAATNGYAKKTRSMSLAHPVEFRPLSAKSVSISSGMTQAAIEESIRASLAASIAEDSSDCSKKPFLHIKAKYRSPPPREVPPR